MRVCLISLLTLAPLLGSASATHAHIGDQIYPFYELLDEDLDHIDLTDGSVEDWLEVIGEPSLTAIDFVWGGLWQPFQVYDPLQVDFRIWLAWNESTSTLWIAMERIDDLYFNLYDGREPWDMQQWDSSMRFLVDGDHSGGFYSYTLGRYCEKCTPEQVLEDNRQAQQWMVIAETSNGEPLFHLGASEWVAREPYAAAGGGVINESPATTVTEFKVTPFDDLIYDDEDASEASRLYPGKTIGFEIRTTDNDDTEFRDGSGTALLMWLTGRTKALNNSDFFVDGLLLGVGEDPSRYDDDSAVTPSSWARIKAALE